MVKFDLATVVTYERGWLLLAIASRRTTKNDRPSYGAVPAFHPPLVSRAPLARGS